MKVDLKILAAVVLIALGVLVASHYLYSNYSPSDLGAQRNNPGVTTEKGDALDQGTCGLVSDLGGITGYAYDFCGFGGASRDASYSEAYCQDDVFVQNELDGAGESASGTTLPNLLGSLQSNYFQQVDRDFQLVFSSRDPAFDSTLYKQSLQSGQYSSDLYATTGYLSVCIYKSSNAVFFAGEGHNHCVSFYAYVIPGIADTAVDPVKGGYLGSRPDRFGGYSVTDSSHAESYGLVLERILQCP